MAEIVIPIRITPEDIHNIAVAVAAKLKPSFDQITQQEQLMSDALSVQLSDIAQRVSNDVATIRADIDAVLNRLNPGDVVTQADVDAMRLAVDGLDSAVTALNDVAQPVAPPAP